ENSLFMILMRKDWWVSALCAVATFALVQNFMPWGYALFATTPFTIITLMVIWKQIRVPSGARLERRLEQIRALPWEAFAAKLEAAFRAEGFNVKPIKGAADFELEKLGYVTLVSARRWKVARTGAEPIKELVEYGEKRDARQCRYVAAGEVTEQARAYAKEQGVTLIEGVELLKLVG
ncbi:MAG: restriction endonuclease, partial [Burkholderiales bacterium]